MAFKGTLAVVGERETIIVGGGVTVTLSEADLVGSDMSVAVMVAVRLLAAVAGASYSTVKAACLLRVPGPLSTQVTPLPEESLTVVTLRETD